MDGAPLPKKVDFLIVGHGLAGSLLVWRLIQHKQRVTIVDRDSGVSASRTAAGLVNPITGKRFTTDSRFETFLSSAKELYESLEEFFETRFFFKKSLLRIFSSQQEHALWQKRKTEPGYIHYLKDNFNERVARYDLNAPLGGYSQKFCGYLDANLLLESLKFFFSETHCFNGTGFSHNDLVIKDSGFDWRGYGINNIIFCEGYWATNNTLFSWLPFQPSKGEILTLKTDQVLPPEIISRGKWLLPLGDGLYSLGATYQWSPLDDKPSESAKRELLQLLKQIFRQSIEFNIIDHKAGIRPNTMDKQPFIGVHPRIPGISIFNGFGSKGVLTIPWYVDRFVDFLLKGTPLPLEADISRYSAGIPPT